MEKKLGKILNVKFGVGGYQDCQLGLHVTLGTDGWGVNDSFASWDATRITHTEHTKWTEDDRDKNYAGIMRHLSKLLADAKVENVADLKGVPVECTFDGNMLKKWRILTEVI